jgi:Lhr-like helicase
VLHGNRELGIEKATAASRGRPIPDSGFPIPDVQVQTTDDGIMLRLPNLGGSIPIDAFIGLDPAEAERRIIDEVGSTSLFGARFRMNAARALLLPRGNPQKRMPLWLQRLKALDLLQTVQAFPSFPILVETYRDVLQDAFDMSALATVPGRPAARRDSRARRGARPAVALCRVAAVRVRHGLVVRR